ncbi:MAG: iron-containing alcohol dehydrogenase [Clostridiales bacterium]|jgi:glycerol-1-phosphate dehydrogenase [NAD(P)+]|nr:iron-containing alcohol dehydrogenase [Clostridiales bacterium]
MEINIANTLNISRFAGAAFRCDTCGTHNVVTREITVGADASAHIAGFAVQHLGGSGRVLVAAGRRSFDALGSKAVRFLTEAGFTVDTLVVTGRDTALTEITAALKDDTRLVISAGGGAVADYVKLAAHKAGLPVVIMMPTPSSDNYLAPYSYIEREGFWERAEVAPPIAVIADLDVIGAAPTSHHAAAYGLIMSKIIAVFDSYFSNLMRGTPHCERIADLIYASVGSCVEANAGFVRHERKSVGLITENVIRMSLLKQMAPGQIMTQGGAETHFAVFAERYMTENKRGCRMFGEHAFLGAQIVSGLYKLMLKDAGADIFPPPDILARAERFSEVTGLQEHRVLARYAGVPDGELYAVTAYKYREYRAELYQRILRSEKIIAEAVRTFRHIYSDAGYWCRKYLTDGDYRTILALAADTHPEYTLLMHMRNAGYLEQYLP